MFAIVRAIMQQVQLCFAKRRTALGSELCSIEELVVCAAAVSAGLGIDSPSWLTLGQGTIDILSDDRLHVTLHSACNCNSTCLLSRRWVQETDAQMSACKVQPGVKPALRFELRSISSRKKQIIAICLNKPAKPSSNQSNPRWRNR